MKPIRMKLNLAVAEKVRKAINRLNTSTELMRRAHFESFDNCREQGYVMIVYPETFLIKKTLHIAFSENRNSDDIVVYLYTETDFPNNLPAEGHWNDRNYFRYDAIEEAAKFILKKAIQHCEKEKHVVDIID